MRSKTAYAEDLAYAHDQGFNFLANHAAPFLIEELRKAERPCGQIVSLGCGSGIAESKLAKAGYDVTGFDQSREMLKLAAKRSRAVRWKCASYVDTALPACDAVCAFGEVFNYRFDERATKRALDPVFRRIFAALRPGGLLVFDLAEPARSSRPQDLQKHFLGDDWALCVTVSKNKSLTQLTRNITLFRKVGRHYRRSDETHRLNLYPAGEIAKKLRQAGFRVRIAKQYGDLRAILGLKIIVAKKPARS